jgi:hypothetical protein
LHHLESTNRSHQSAIGGLNGSRIGETIATLPAKIRIGLCLLYHSLISCKQDLLHNGILLQIFPITLYQLSNN